MFWKGIEDLIHLDHGLRPAHTENFVACEIGQGQGGEGEGGGERGEVIEK